MSAVTRLPAVAGALTVAGAIAAFVSHPTVQQLVKAKFGDNAGSTMLKLLAGAFALANLKNLPGFWHIRVLRGIIYQIYFQKRDVPPKHLFAPMVTQSYNTLWDTDYNIHKSNSTYFADLDVSRAHAVGAIVRTGLSRLNAGDQQGLPKSNIDAKGKYVVALGAVSCFFQRQIEPFERFEIYTRVLSWDRKWLYTISHIVKKGTVKPDSYVLQPWKNPKRKSEAQRKKKEKKKKEEEGGGGEKEEEEEEDEEEEEEDLTKYVFATSIARYVFKKGRLTINPEIVLERSRLLPSRPEGVGFPPRSEAVGGSVVATPFTPATPALNGSAEVRDVGDVLQSKLKGVQESVEDLEWTWDTMEKERLRGLKLASHFDAMGTCHGELRGGDVLGKFGDYW